MHESALGAAHGAQCAAEQGAFDSYQKLLYSSQELFGRQSWVEYARKAGVTDIGKFGACMTNTTTMAIVERDRADGKRLGINGTPAFLINDLQVSGYQDVDELESMVRAALRSSPQRMARR
jgi:protein-disulfide isomerase